VLAAPTAVACEPPLAPATAAAAAAAATEVAPYVVPAGKWSSGLPSGVVARGITGGTCCCWGTSMSNDPSSCGTATETGPLAAGFVGSEKA